MKNILKLALCFALLIATACKDSPEVAAAKELEKAEQSEFESKLTEFTSLKDEAMNVHDEVMPDAMIIPELTEKMEALSVQYPDAEELAVTKSKLEAAHDDMMNWMREYGEAFPYGEPAPETLEQIKEKLPVLEQKVEKIKSLQQETENVIKYARKLFRQAAKNQFEQ